MKKHEWRDNTDEGVIRLVRVTQHAGKWQLQSRLKSDAECTKFPVIPLDDPEIGLEGRSWAYVSIIYNLTNDPINFW